MKTKILITVAVILALGSLYAFYYTFRHIPSTQEGNIMIQACDAVLNYEQFSAEERFEKLQMIIAEHTHSYRNHSDTVIANTILELEALKDEAMFRNIDEEMYHKQLSHVLIQLAKVELEDALNYYEMGQQDKVKKALKECKHYLHDSIILYDQSPTERLLLLHKINSNYPNNITSEDLIAHLHEFEKLN